MIVASVNANNISSPNARGNKFEIAFSVNFIRMRDFPSMA